ncbi:MAG: TIGR03749 family integrating conjugative element protein [Gammaproteobacteria bacterium]
MKKYIVGVILCGVLNMASAADVTAGGSSPTPLLAEANTTADNRTVASDVTYAATSPITLPGDEHIVWDKRPISFVIPTGKERMISFPGQVQLINTNPDLTANKLSFFVNDGTFYMKALKPFAPIRVVVQIQATGEHVLLDIASTPQADDTPVDVVMAASNQATNDTSTADDTTNQAVSYVDLLRYAIQTFYAPARLISSSPTVMRTPMYTHKSVVLFYGDNTIAMPIASWRGGDLFVTAVVIKNTRAYPIVLDPRLVKGNWLAAAFYPANQLAAQGHAHDKTTLFLISSAPFGGALAAINEESA